MRLDGIVLDLDDTLYDTSGLLIPAADRRAAAVLRGAGLPLGEGEILARMLAARAAGSARTVRDAAAAAGAGPEAALAAEAAWLAYDPPEMHLDPDVARTLDRLAALAPLALLTAGDAETQRRKVARLGIAHRFAVSRYADPRAGGTKPDSLRSILAETGWHPALTVVAGDRPDGDVRAANVCGCLAVLVRRAGTEAAAVEPEGPHDIAWRTVSHVRELPALLAAAR